MLYNTCHITITLHVSDMTFKSAGGGNRDRATAGLEGRRASI